MDGNGRWAMGKGLDRTLGHQNGVQAVRDAAEGCAELGIKVLTLYAFSAENWNRPQYEVDALMALLVSTIGAEMPTLVKNNISLKAIGDLQKLPEATRKELEGAIALTEHHSGMQLVLALSYSARWDILQATNKLVTKGLAGRLEGEVTEAQFKSHLSTAPYPDPELLIRTSGEHRISNFLLWELAYTELFFCPKLWPDFRKEDLEHALQNFAQRERRFGLTHAQ